jgi:hypothetical protein
MWFASVLRFCTNASQLVVGRTVTLTAIEPDKEDDKRVDAFVQLPDGRDLGNALIAVGLARPYWGGQLQGWCD